MYRVHEGSRGRQDLEMWTVAVDEVSRTMCGVECGGMKPGRMGFLLSALLWSHLNKLP